MNSRDVALGTINQFKQGNCNTLITSMSHYWTGALLKQGPLDWTSIILLAQQVKDNAKSIVQVCKDQDGYVGWEKIRKRQNNFSDPTSAKRQRLLDPLHGDRDAV